MKILIISKRNDSHAFAVFWGLQALGANPIMWFWEDFPRSDLGILKVSQDKDAELSLYIGGTCTISPFDVIWKRRIGHPTPMDESHADDLKIIKKESREYLENLIPFIANKSTKWVNKYDADRIADNKILQLIEAKSVGFLIPDTVIGNNPEEIRSFFWKHKGRIIFKAFNPGGWKNEDGSSTVLRTSAIFEEHVLDDYLLKSCPAIYQEQIDKKYELRVTVMGDAVIAAAIYSQEIGETLDWRYEGGGGFENLKLFQISEKVKACCIALCKKMDLSFGCIDLIVKKNEEVVFLEVNCAGQFLWKEDADQNIPMLDSFCRFLIDGQVSDLANNKGRILLADYYKSEIFKQFVDSNAKFA